MEQSFWPSSFESIKDQRNLKNWMSSMEELPGGPVTNLKANDSVAVKNDILNLYVFLGEIGHSYF